MHIKTINNTTTTLITITFATNTTVIVIGTSNVTCSCMTYYTIITINIDSEI